MAKGSLSQRRLREFSSKLAFGSQQLSCSGGVLALPHMRMGSPWSRGGSSRLTRWPCGLRLASLPTWESTSPSDFPEQRPAVKTVPDNPMGYLRLVSSAAAVPAPESACLDAFDRELDYLFETIRRLGARPSEVEDLVQEVFVVLHRNWPTLDTTRSLPPYLFG